MCDGWTLLIVQPPEDNLSTVKRTKGVHLFCFRSCCRFFFVTLTFDSSVEFKCSHIDVLFNKFESHISFICFIVAKFPSELLYTLHSLPLMSVFTSVSALTQTLKHSGVFL